MPGKTLNRDELVEYLARTLDINRFRDYSPNGLQVEGRAQIKHLVTGVTASVALLEAAAEAGADAVLVHHGYFWRGEDPCITGMRARRIRFLLQKDISLFAYHLPLDAHPEFGNNATLGARLGLQAEGRFGDDDLGWLGRVDDPAVRTVGDFARVVEQRLGRAPLLLGDATMPLGRIGWCTGGAQSYFADAVAAGATVFLTGEASEHSFHTAMESGAAYLGAGHHATERYGVQALGQHLADTFGIRHTFIDIPNPV